MTGSRSALLAALCVATLAHSSSEQSPAGKAAVSRPATAAGRATAEWLDAFNSGDSLKLGTYYGKWHLVRNLSQSLRFSRETGGFELVSIERNDPRLIEFVVRERNRPENRAFGVIEIGAGDTTLSQSYLNIIPAGTTLAAFRIDGAARTRVIDN